MSDEIRIVLIGNSLQAKCAVGNAILNQEKGFQHFSCRQEFVAKKIVGNRSLGTVAGRQLLVTLTPNLNTPAWANAAEKTIKKYIQMIFVYVKAPGQVKIDEEKSIDKIKEIYKKKPMCVVSYYGKDQPMENPLPENVLHDCSGNRTTFATALLADIGKAIYGNSEKAYTGPGEVDSRKRAILKVPPSNDCDLIPEISIETLRIETHQRENTNELELKENLDKIDVELFTKTLKFGRAKSNHVRVNVIGNQSAGKTTLVKRLQNLDVKCPDNTLKPTEALEISQICSRCIEINGERKWDTNVADYTSDLNEQRMAHAMKNIIKANSSDADTDSLLVDQLQEPEFMLGSYVEEDIAVEQQQYYEEFVKEKGRTNYIKNIIRKRDHSRGERMYVSYWDFAGQSTYYSTHQMFMSSSAVYVLVVDLSLDLETKLQDSLNFCTGITKECTVKESLIFWLSSIKAFASDANGESAPIIIVGTHVDEVKKEALKQNTDANKLIEKKFKEFRGVLKMSLVECIAIDNANPDVVQLVFLRNRILEYGLGVIDEEIPAQWINLERHLNLKKIQGLVLMKFSELEKLDLEMDFPIKDISRLEAFLGHQHNRGYLIHFKEENLKGLIILEPDVLAKFLNALMRARPESGEKIVEKMGKAYNKNGLINRDYIVKTAEMISEFRGEDQIADTLTYMLIHLCIIRPYSHDGSDMRYLLPCLLPPRTETKELKGLLFQVVFTDSDFPPPFYHVLLAALLNEWKPVEKTVGKPELYNLYACFRLESETQMVEIFWKSSCIYINVVNCSQLMQLTEMKILHILQTIRKNVAKIFTIYRQSFSKYEVRCQCPIHSNIFVSLQQLEKFGEAMCFTDESDHHAVLYKTIFGAARSEEKDLDLLQQKPSDAHLGRLARYLVREKATALAPRLKLFYGLILADSVAENTSDEKFRRLLIFDRWRSANGASTISDLVDLLTETMDYQREDLLQCLKESSGKYSYDLGNEKLDVIPSDDIDIKIVCNLTGAEYPFLALELGLRITDINIARENSGNKLWETVFDLLKQWRYRKPKIATTRVLLDVATAVGLNMNAIQTQLMRA